MIEEKLTRDILNILLSGGADFSEIFVQKRSSNNIKLEDSKIENSTSGFDSGCGLRLWFGESTFYGFVDSLQSEKLRTAAKVLSSAAVKSGKCKVLDLSENKSKYRPSIKKYPSSVDPGIKKDILFSVDKSSRDFNSKIIQVTSSLSDIEEETYIANSYGSFSRESVVRVFLAVNVVARNRKDVRTGYKSLAKTSGYEALDGRRPRNLALEASRIAVTMLDSVNAPIGIQPVVIGPAFGGVIFHEASGHGLEADAVVKDSTVFKDKIGKKIASSMVTAVDDPTTGGSWGSYKFDGEGFPSQRTVLIKDGILESYIYDLKSAKKLGAVQTGNGRRQSYRHIPIPRMSNTYIDRGTQSHESIIRSVNKGIYAKEFAGGQVDPATGDFVFGISEGYMIENGRLGQPIKGATLIGNGPEVLKNIEAVADDLEFAPGFCGKGGQSISNEVGQPTIKVSGITVGGTKG